MGAVAAPLLVGKGKTESNSSESSEIFLLSRNAKPNGRSLGRSANQAGRRAVESLNPKLSLALAPGIMREAQAQTSPPNAKRRPGGPPLQRLEWQADQPAVFST